MIEVHEVHTTQGPPALARAAVAATTAFALCVLCAGAAAQNASQTTAAPPPPVAGGAETGVANINLTPRRIIFDRTKRSDTVYVFNQGNAAVTVDVALIDNVMLPSGEILPVARAAEKGPAAVAAAASVRSARLLLLAVPSRLTLPPGQGRVIRIRASLPESTDVVEYRTHLTVATLPTPDSGLTAEQVAATTRGELVLRVQSIFGVSIPLIVRTGAANATATLGAIAGRLEGDKPVLEIPVMRQGTTSLYGDLEVRAGTGGTGEVVGLVRGLGVYPEVDERLARIPLSRALRKGEAVTVSYFTADGKPGELARRTFTVP